MTPRRVEGEAGKELAPSAAELHRLYVVEDLPMAALAARYKVGSDRIRAWLVDAGIPIRTKRQAGRRRQLSPPPPAELRRLYVIRRLAAYEIAATLGVSTATVLRWLAEAGVEVRRAPLKGRPRGQRDMMVAPGEATLRRLYKDERRPLADVAAELGATVHLVRTWMDEYGIARRPAGGSSRPRKPRPRRHQPPPRDELHRLRVVEHWSLPELAERYAVSAPTVRGWLGEYDIVMSGHNRRLPGVTVAELVDRYQGDPTVTVSALARLVGLDGDRVASELRAAGVQIDRRRGQLRPAPGLGPAERQCVVQRYVADGWSILRIAEAQGLSPRRVRAALVAAGISIVRRGGALRGERLEAPPEQVERFYVQDQLTARETGETVGFESDVVLRTGHSYGLPIRHGGNPIVPADVRLIEDLYADETVAAILQRHGVPRRPPTGGIATRFPTPVALTYELVRSLYVDAGCSSTHIELLTGQAAATVVKRMAQWDIAVRQGKTNPPFLARVRAARRQAWLDQVVERYQQTGSTRQVAWEQGCSQMTIERWLAKAGSSCSGVGSGSAALSAGSLPAGPRNDAPSPPWVPSPALLDGRLRKLT